MARAPSTFRQKDVTRAIRAAIAGGVDIARIEVAKDGRIFTETAVVPEPKLEANERDRIGCDGRPNMSRPSWTGMASRAFPPPALASKRFHSLACRGRPPLWRHTKQPWRGSHYRSAARG